MKNKIKFSIFVIILLVFSVISVYAATTSLCETTFGNQNYKCTTGNINDLKNQGLDCKQGKVCNGDYCCGTAANLYCCQTQSVTPLNSNVFDFLSIAGMSYLVSNYQGLSVPPGYGYLDLQQRATSVNVKVGALYAEATGYKEIAKLRREFIGLPINVLLENENARKIVKTPASQIATSTTQKTQQAAVDLTGQPCGGTLLKDYSCISVDKVVNQQDCASNCQDNPNFLCCKTQTSTTSSSTIIPKKSETTTQGFIPNRALILRATGGRDMRIYYQNKWQWCKTSTNPLKGNECADNYVTLTINSPSSSDFWFVGDEYVSLVKDLPNLGYEEGITNLLTNLAQLQIDKGTKMPLTIATQTIRGLVYVDVLLTLNKQKDSIDIKIGNTVFANAFDYKYPADNSLAKTLTKTEQFTEVVKAIVAYNKI